MGPGDLGQGAALALEDAVTLATYAGPARSHEELALALTRYDRERRPRTQKLVTTSALVGRIAQARSRLGAGSRDVVTGLPPARVYLRASTGTFSWTPPELSPLRRDPDPAAGPGSS